MCPLTVDPRYASGSGRPRLLDPRLFDRLAPLFPTLQRAYLFGLGEPLLSPHLFDFGRRLSTAGVEVWTTTNGTRVGDEQAEALAEAGFDRVTLSLDGARRETYERIRRRGRFEDVLRGLRALGRVRRERGRPRLHVNFVAMASNVDEMADIVELCAAAGGDGVFVETLYDWQDPRLAAWARREDLGGPGPARVEAALERARRRAAAAGIGLTSRLDDAGFGGMQGGNGAGPGPAVAAGPRSGARLPFPCSEPWSTVAVSTAGEVRTCCFNDTVLGDLRQQSSEEIWRGEPFIELRRRHAALETPEGCTGCVRCGRVKRSPFLTTEPAGTTPALSGSRGAVEVPGELELAPDPLVVAGRLPYPRNLWPPAHRPPALPEVFLDGHLLARVGDSGVIDGHRFAVVIPIPFVSEGAHRLEVRGPAEDGGRLWSERRILVGRLGARPAAAPAGASAAVTAETAVVSRLALAVDLERPESSPRLLLGGRRHRLESWICGTWGDAFRAVAVADVSGLRPGTYRLELRLRHHPPVELRLHRLAVEGSFGFGRAPRAAAAL
jgi:MoaA/NifB/PqqE/SkfB family radical SAM enzyme